ncbi:MAG: circularly permuted type 2 ATP-grasp protein, partial [Acidimicrobiia bacterium]|nr:circularly permuted type 2 ATP-grasp protein [Acidimicrobiia bacterium]
MAGASLHFERPPQFADLARLAAIGRNSDRLLKAEGAGHLVHDLPVLSERPRPESGGPWRLDPVPYLIDGPSFDLLESAVATRATFWEAVLRDLYGPRQLIAGGVVPPDVVFGSPRFRLGQVGVVPAGRWLTNYALDVVRRRDGGWS